MVGAEGDRSYAPLKSNVLHRFWSNDRKKIEKKEERKKERKKPWMTAKKSELGSRDKSATRGGVAGRSEGLQHPVGSVE